MHSFSPSNSIEISLWSLTDQVESILTLKGLSAAFEGAKALRANFDSAGIHYQIVIDLIKEAHACHSFARWASALVIYRTLFASASEHDSLCIDIALACHSIGLFTDARKLLETISSTTYAAAQLKISFAYKTGTYDLFDREVAFDLVEDSDFNSLRTLALCALYQDDVQGASVIARRVSPANPHHIRQKRLLDILVNAYGGRLDSDAAEQLCHLLFRLTHNEIIHVARLWPLLNVLVDCKEIAYNFFWYILQSKNSPFAENGVIPSISHSPSLEKVAFVVEDVPAARSLYHSLVAYSSEFCAGKTPSFLIICLDLDYEKSLDPNSLVESHLNGQSPGYVGLRGLTTAAALQILRDLRIDALIDYVSIFSHRWIPLVSARISSFQVSGIPPMPCTVAPSSNLYDAFVVDRWTSIPGNMDSKFLLIEMPGVSRIISLEHDARQQQMGSLHPSAMDVSVSTLLLLGDPIDFLPRAQNLISSIDSSMPERLRWHFDSPLAQAAFATAWTEQSGISFVDSSSLAMDSASQSLSMKIALVVCHTPPLQSMVKCLAQGIPVFVYSEGKSSLNEVRSLYGALGLDSFVVETLQDLVGVIDQLTRDYSAYQEISRAILANIHASLLSDSRRFFSDLLSGMRIAFAQRKRDPVESP